MLYEVITSCHELCIHRENRDVGLLVDCGLLQERGADAMAPVDFPVRHLAGLVLTHVHVDHCGRIPALLAARYTGPIYCSVPSAKLLPLVLEDTIRVGLTRDRKQITRLLDRIERQVQPLAYGVWHRVVYGEDLVLSIRLQPAGHIRNNFV